MSRGPIVVAILQKENAVEDFRKLIGSTNPELAEKEQLDSYMQPLLEKMLFMYLTVTKMQQ